LGSAIAVLISYRDRGFFALLDVVEDNTALAKGVKDKMRQLDANVCFTIYNEILVVNMLMPNGKYTTFMYGTKTLSG
jgi:hypothetical protein